MDKLCSKSSIRAVKLVRATMEEISYFLHKNKKCVRQIKVIHLLRDPRGRLNSLHKCCKFNYSDSKKVLEMCQRQIKDVIMAKQLEEIYPETFMEVHYEHLASDTVEVSQNIYNFLFNLNQPDEINKWIKSIRSIISESTWNTNRKDPKATSQAWKTEIPSKVEKVIKENCQELLKHLELH